MGRYGIWTGLLLAAVVTASAGCDGGGATPTGGNGGPAPVESMPEPADAQPAVKPEPPAAVSPLAPHWGILTSLTSWDAATPDARRAAVDAVAGTLDAFKFQSMRTLTCGAQSHEVGAFRHPKSGLFFSLVPGGEFDAGSPPEEPGREPEETLHRVTLTAPFLISCTEVTQSAWKKVMGSKGPSRYPNAKHPVENVTWEDADAFCENAGVALPTEAQWEYACRAGSSAAFCFGDDESKLDEYAWYSAPNTDLTSTQNVAGKKPNAFGLFDMHGNVWEYCADWKADYPSGPVVDPRGSGNATRYRVVRGGSFGYKAQGARCAYRTGAAQRAKSKIRGFRVVLNIWLD